MALYSVSAPYPYEGYRVYKVWHKKMGRHMAILFKSKKDRTTVAWAKYLWETTHRVKLAKGQQVDHCDEDRTNDNLENLQVLTTGDNIRKHRRLKRPPAKIVELTCPVCLTRFNRRFGLTNMVPCNSRNKRMFCTRACMGRAFMSDANRLAA